MYSNPKHKFRNNYDLPPFMEKVFRIKRL